MYLLSFRSRCTVSGWNDTRCQGLSSEMRRSSQATSLCLTKDLHVLLCHSAYLHFVWLIPVGFYLETKERLKRHILGRKGCLPLETYDAVICSVPLTRQRLFIGVFECLLSEWKLSRSVCLSIIPHMHPSGARQGGKVNTEEQSAGVKTRLLRCLECANPGSLVAIV